MPTDHPLLTIEAARSRAARTCFTPTGRGRVGIEIEALTSHRDGRRPRADEVADLVNGPGPLPGAGSVSVEPGGQVEVSTAPHHSLADTIAACAKDVDAVRARLAAAGITTALVGYDPVRSPVRVTDAPRYRAMQAYFDAQGAAGRAMMCNTASVQVNVDLDGPGGPLTRWRRAHHLGPVLAAAFANSPLCGGRASGFRSLRLATWRAIDPSRTAPVLRSDEPARDWADYALGARLMFVADEGTGRVPVLDGMRLRDWVESGRAGTWPTEEDLDAHLTTLFPPVRPRGWLELRFLDAVPDPWWRVAVAVTVALLDDAEAADAAERACTPSAAAWDDAARWGLGHPALAAAARACFSAAIPALERMGADPGTIAATATYTERFVARHCTPADELLAAWCADPRRTGVHVPVGSCSRPAGVR